MQYAHCLRQEKAPRGALRRDRAGHKTSASRESARPVLRHTVEIDAGVSRKGSRFGTISVDLSAASDYA